MLDTNDDKSPVNGPAPEPVLSKPTKEGERLADAFDTSLQNVIAAMRRLEAEVESPGFI